MSQLKAYDFKTVNEWVHDTDRHFEELQGACLDMAVRIERLTQDEKRLDWLADKHNRIGNVTLPVQCVLDNLSSLRGAIDAAMAVPNKEANK